jgi:hypothetical protein
MLTSLWAEQQGNHGSTVDGVKDLLYRAPTHTGAHHRYRQCCATGDSSSGRGRQNGRGVTLATHFYLPPNLPNKCLIRHRDNFTLSTCRIYAGMIQSVFLKVGRKIFSSGMFLNTQRAGHYVMP